MATTASDKQITYIRHLLDDKSHADTGRMITVGDQRFRTTVEKLDTISSTVASRLIAALQNAPRKSQTERELARERAQSRTTPEPTITQPPHFAKWPCGWVVAAPDPEWKKGDTVTVIRRDKSTTDVILDHKVKLLSTNDVAWQFRNAALDTRPATYSQVAFAIGMLDELGDDADGIYDGPRESDDLHALSRDEISTHITALKKAVSHVRAERADDLPATAAQVNLIWDLVCKGNADQGGIFNGPRDLDGIKKLTRGTASFYITSLLEDC